MHYLHRILVKYPRSIHENEDKEKAMRNVVNNASYYTENYADRAFDWRETETAGSWEDEYPENVIFSKDDLRRFLGELQKSLDYQKSEIEYHLGKIKEVSTDIEQIIGAPSVSYNFYQLGCLLQGDYDCDSCFFDLDEYSARITQATIDKVKESPQDWALAFFDYHM